MISDDDDNDDCVFLGVTTADSSSGLNLTGEVNVDSKTECQKKCSLFPTWLFKMEDVKEVDEVLDTIDGKCLFAVKCKKDRLLEKIKDRRNFYMTTSKVTGFNCWWKVG